MIDEHRLAELLQQAVPQPRRRITAADIAAQVTSRPSAGPPRFRLWLPAVAAAAVLLVVAAASVWLISGHSRRSAPAAQSSSAATSAATSATNAASSASSSPQNTASRIDPDSTTSVIPAGVIGAFGAQLLNVVPIGPIIVSGAGAVYGLEGATIDRFDLTSGATTAQAPAGQGANWPPVVTSRALWQTVVTPGAVTIRMLDPRTLQQVGSTQIAAATPSSTGTQWTPALATSADDSMIFLGNADQLYSLNPSSGAVEQQVSIPGLVGALAVSPNGNRLYVGVNVQGSGIPRLLVLDVRHGLATLSNTPLDNGPVTSLLATSGGVWATLGPPPDEYGIKNNSIRFAPLNDLSHTRDAILGGGGLPATATLAGGSVFLSGVYYIECADPRTAAVRAQASQLGELGLSHNFLSVQLVDGRYFASFQTNYHGNQGLAILTPPAACR